MNAFPRVWIVTLVVSASWPSFAADLDPAQAEALAKTQALLTSPPARDKAVSESPGAQKADQNVRHLLGNGGNAEAAYGISSQVFEELIRENGGDSAKAQEILENAQRDPTSFYQSLSPESRQAIQDLSKKAGQATHQP
ncbi:MAG: hypothetical protein AB7P04_10675 [Bacteriovoracia bacterium]